MAISFANFLHMGGYAPYIWPSYGLAAIVLMWLLFSARADMKLAKKTLEGLQSALSSAKQERNL